MEGTTSLERDRGWGLWLRLGLDLGLRLGLGSVGARVGFGARVRLGSGVGHTHECRGGSSRCRVGEMKVK